jgi:hypothetical protein
MNLAPILLLSTLLAGCAAPADTGYPSLLPRPIEKRGFSEPERPTPVAAPDPVLDGRIAQEQAALAKANAAFDAGATTAERLAAKAGNAAPGTEAWIAAQVALAELDTLRSATAGSLADIEQLAIDRASEGKPPYPALESLQAQAQAQNQGEIDRVTRIQASMRAA